MLRSLGETNHRSYTQVGRGYAPIGQTPEIDLSSQRVSVNYIASISNQGKVRFMLYTQNLTAQIFILFLERLIEPKACCFDCGSSSVHRSSLAVVQEHRDNIEMHLPSYAPQLNPAETTG